MTSQPNPTPARRSPLALLAPMLLAAALLAGCAAPAPDPGDASTAAIAAAVEQDRQHQAEALPPQSAPTVPRAAPPMSDPLPPLRAPERAPERDPQRAPRPDAINAPVVVDTSCTRDADCTIKNVGNCCGEYPACVNVDSPTDPEGVQARCAREGTMSVCGFPSISACQCVAGQCRGDDAAVEQ